MRKKRQMPNGRVASARGNTTHHATHAPLPAIAARASYLRPVVACRCGAVQVSSTSNVRGSLCTEVLTRTIEAALSSVGPSVGEPGRRSPGMIITRPAPTRARAPPARAARCPQKETRELRSSPRARRVRGRVAIAIPSSRSLLLASVWGNVARASLSYCRPR